MVVSLDLQPEGSDSASRRTLQSLSLAVAKSKKIVVVTGAGISCSCGIPDFRSSDGLYNLVKKQYPNVDVRNVQLHGDIHRVRCTFCSVDLPCTEEYLRLFDEGLPPDCPECTLRSEARLARAARPLKIGTLRPAIVLYDEAHPLGDDIGCIQSADVSRKPDMLIIMGTSLKVHGLRKLVKEFAKSVHASAPFHDPSSNKPPTRKDAYKVVFVNKTPPGSEWNGIIDYHVAGETDEWAGMVLRDWRKAIPGDFEVQQTLEEAVEDTGDAFRLVKDVSGGKGTSKSLFCPPQPCSYR
ncbi:DHS-like NAD/FAD-binding domain-containing protein [Amylostereum chailletii]|nr:DHS-like NAD/FAD-binding domain-containing protein [Amylostereum chailletii]